MFAGAKLYKNLPIEIRKLEDLNFFSKEIKRDFNQFVMKTFMICYENVLNF